MGQYASLGHSCLGVNSCDVFPVMYTLHFLFVIYARISRTSFVGRPICVSLYSSPECHSLSNARSMSKKTASVQCPLLNPFAIPSVSFSSGSFVE